MASEDITLVEAFNLTSKYLPSWKQLSIQDLDISKLCGGYANRLYKLVNISTTKTVPKELVIRIYGGKMFDGYGVKIMSEPEEVLLFNELSNRKLGPKLFGVFSGGMLTEFIPNHTLNNDDIANSSIRREIARNLAKYHALDIPVNKTPLSIISKAEHYLELFNRDVKTTLTTLEAREVLSQETVDVFTTFDFESEIEWIRDQESKLVSPLVFAIIDMNRANCLIRNEQTENGERVVLVGYDCSQLAPRGIDLRNHFSNHVIDANNSDLQSGLDYPSEEVRREYVGEYLRESKRIGLIKESNDAIDSVDHVVMEAEFYGMMLNFMFSIMMANILPGFIEQKDRAVHYPLIILKLYQDRKAAFIAEYGPM